MRQILQQDFLDRYGLNDQPGVFQNTAILQFSEIYSGKLVFLSLGDSPIVYSEREEKYYIYENGRLLQNHEDICIMSIIDISQEVSYLTEEEFNEKFDGLGSKLTKIFKEKAEFENVLSMIVSNELLDEWFESLTKQIDGQDKEKIKKALDFCKEKHYGQLRDDYTQYSSHPIFVAIKGILYGCNRDQIITLLLHDVIEDTTASYDDLVENFGKKIADDVLSLSKKDSGKRIKGEDEYYKKLSEDENLSLLKGLDRLGNLYSLIFSDKNSDKRKKYLLTTKEQVIPILNDRKLISEIEMVLKFLEDEKYNIPKSILDHLNGLKQQMSASHGLRQDVSDNVSKIFEK